LVTLLRIRLIAGNVAALAVLLSLALGLGAVVLHLQALFTIALVALAASMLANAFLEGWRAYVLFNSGSWSSLDGRPVSRAQQPSKFKLWVTLHLVFAGIWCAGTGFLILSTHLFGL
jgi:hypothetical protein